uniref:Uncharacterized protein n=1 Tax=viral metagenome TaxID=1070528 RepID=A0A6C0JUC1_9ZZZZ
MSGNLLVEQLLLPENTKRIGEVFTSIATVLGKQAVTVVDDNMPFITVTVRDNTPIVTMSRTFIAGIGTHKLVVTGNFTEDRIYEAEEPAPIETTIDLPAKTIAPTDIQQLIDDGYIIFTKKETAGYTVTCKPNVLDNLDGPIVNLVKRGTVDEQIYKHLCSTLGQKHYLVGDPWPEPVVYTVTDTNTESNNQTSESNNQSNQTSDCPGGMCSLPPRLQAHPSTGPHHQQIQVVTKYVITEKLVETQKLVIKEVPVEVERIVKVPYEVIKEVYICKHTAGPISTNVDDSSKPTAKRATDDPDEDVDDKKPVAKQQSSKPAVKQPVAKTQSAKPTKKAPPTPSASSDEQESSHEQSNESEDQTDNISSTEPDTPPKKVQIKGTWLTDDKTVLKSGKYVFRVSRGGESGSKFEAIGRFNPSSKTKRDPLQQEDISKIKALGKQYSIARNCMPE